MEATHAALLERFRKATLRRLQDAQGRQWREGDALLDHHAFAADEAPLLREPLALAVRFRWPAWSRVRASAAVLTVPAPVRTGGGVLGAPRA